MDFGKMPPQEQPEWNAPVEVPPEETTDTGHPAPGPDDQHREDTSSLGCSEEYSKQSEPEPRADDPDLGDLIKPQDFDRHKDMIHGSSAGKLPIDFMPPKEPVVFLDFQKGDALTPPLAERLANMGIEGPSEVRYIHPPDPATDEAFFERVGKIFGLGAALERHEIQYFTHDDEPHPEVGPEPPIMEQIDQAGAENTPSNVVNVDFGGKTPDGGEPPAADGRRAEHIASELDRTLGPRGAHDQAVRDAFLESQGSLPPEPQPATPADEPRPEAGPEPEQRFPTDDETIAALDRALPERELPPMPKIAEAPEYTVVPDPSSVMERYADAINADVEESRRGYGAPENDGVPPAEQPGGPYGGGRGEPDPEFGAYRGLAEQMTRFPMAPPEPVLPDLHRPDTLDNTPYVAVPPLPPYGDPREYAGRLGVEPGLHVPIRFRDGEQPNEPAEGRPAQPGQRGAEPPAGPSPQGEAPTDTQTEQQ